MSMPPPFPDPEIEGKYARPHTVREMAGTLLLSIAGFFLCLALAALVVGLAR